MSAISRRKYTDKKTGERKETAKYYGRVKTSVGWRWVPLCETAELSKKMLRELERKADSERMGLPGATTEAHLNGLILSHLDDFLADKLNEGVRQATVNRWKTRFKALFAFTKWRVLREVNARQAQEHLAELAAVRSPKTLEDLRADYSTFGHWLVKAKRYPENPFEGLKNPARGMEPVRKPRPMTEAELRLVVASAETGRPFKGLTGERRSLLYRLGCFTGLRSAELYSLTGGRVERDSQGRVFVNVTAGCTKSKKTARQAVPDIVADDLLRLVAVLRPEDRLFPGSWHSHAAAMIQADACAAGVETVSETPRGRRVLTFHSLRHSFALWLKTNGVPITLAQLMMRHGDMKLTTETYGQIDDETLHQTVQGIAGAAVPGVPLSHGLSQTNGDECQRVTTKPESDRPLESEKDLENKGFDDERGQVTTGEEERRKWSGRGSNSRPPQCDCGALPAELPPQQNQF